MKRKEVFEAREAFSNNFMETRKPALFAGTGFHQNTLQFYINVRFG